jgi:alpha-L-arabinofuranosidase
MNAFNNGNNSLKYFNKNLLQLFVRIIILFLIIFNYSYSQINAEISINTGIIYGKPVSAFHFGCFFEYSDYNMLGAYGLLAQEINNRGFDTGDQTAAGAPDGWKPYNNGTKQRIKVLPGGYNPNGKYYVNLENYNEGEFGIMQRVWFDVNTDYEFYLYAREKSHRGEYKLKIKLLDFENQGTLKEFQLSGFASEWKKYSIPIPSTEKLYSCNLVISLEGDCDIDIDETSLIASNHKFQLRNAYYEMLKQWKPGIVRYPGGCFSDTRAHHLDYAIGPIDKRESPNYYDGKTQRMEFGYDEYMQFCESLGAEAHLVLNMVFGSPEEAANTVEYFNSPSNTNFGKKRALNGRSEPYKVRYWEIGNEQWDEPPKMLKSYLGMYHAMRAKDSSIQCMVDGDLWGGSDFFDEIYETVGSNCQIYSWHLASGYGTGWGNTDLETYRYLVGCGHNYRTYHNQLNGLIESLPFKQSLGLTELWTAYNGNDYDDHPRHFTLERGLWLASMLINTIRYDNNSDLTEVTWNSGMFRTAYKNSGERLYLTTPSMHALLMMRRNTGINKYFTDTQSPAYSQELNQKYYVVNDVPWIESLVTGDSAYTYIAILNRHDSQHANISIKINDSTFSCNCTGEILTSTHFLDSCSAFEPDKVAAKPKVFIIEDGKITIPAMSFSIIKVPAEITNSIPEKEIKTSAIPNPNFGTLELYLSKLTGIDNETIIISDIFGKVVKTITIPGNPGDYFLDLRDLLSGIYYLKLTRRNEVIPIQVLK